MEGTRIYLRRVRLDKGGYAPGGQYFGIGSPLYVWNDEHANDGGYLRAPTRAAAKALVIAKIPSAVFFN